MFEILTGGVNTRHNANFHMSRSEGAASSVLLIVKSKAAFSIGENTFTVQPDSAIFLLPDTPYEYYPLGTEYIDDWLHFTAQAQDFAAYGMLPLHTPIPLCAVSHCTQYIRQLLWENSYASSDIKTENVDMLFRVLLNNIRLSLSKEAANEGYSPYRAGLQELRLSIQAEPWKKYVPEEIAGAMGISVSYFQHLYSEILGISFHADLIGCRISLARDFIAHTNMTIEKIAEMCGYTNEVHFYRQFKKYTGFTPASYRETAKSDACRGPASAQSTLKSVENHKLL